MKAILEFDLFSLEDRHQHLRCVKSDNLLSVIWNIQNLKRKYEAILDSNPQIKLTDCIDDIWADMVCILEDNNVDLEELGYE